MLAVDLVFTLQYKFCVGFQMFMKQSCPWQHAQLVLCHYQCPVQNTKSDNKIHKVNVQYIQYAPGE